MLWCWVVVPKNLSRKSVSLVLGGKKQVRREFLVLGREIMTSPAQAGCLRLPRTGRLVFSFVLGHVGRGGLTKPTRFGSEAKVNDRPLLRPRLFSETLRAGHHTMYLIDHTSLQ
jgi:hypothetical protein